MSILGGENVIFLAVFVFAAFLFIAFADAIDSRALSYMSLLRERHGFIWLSCLERLSCDILCADYFR